MLSISSSMSATTPLGPSTLGDGTLGDGTLGDGTLGDGTLGDDTLGDDTIVELSRAVGKVVSITSGVIRREVEVKARAKSPGGLAEGLWPYSPALWALLKLPGSSFSLANIPLFFGDHFTDFGEAHGDLSGGPLRGASLGDDTLGEGTLRNDTIVELPRELGGAVSITSAFINAATSAVFRREVEVKSRAKSPGSLSEELRPSCCLAKIPLFGFGTS